MGNPLKVSLENIIPLTYARDHFSQIVNEVQQDKLFVLTKGGTPAVAIIDVKYLESITGGQIDREDVKEEIKKDPQKVGLPPMVEHDEVKNEQKPAGFATPQTPKPFEPPKPAGFAAPMPKPDLNSQKPAGFAAPQPKPTPPMPKPIPPKPTPPPAPKPIDTKPAGFAAPMPTPPTPKPTPPAPISPKPNPDNQTPVSEIGKNPPPPPSAPKTSTNAWDSFGAKSEEKPNPSASLEETKPTPPSSPASGSLVMPNTEPAIPNKPLTTLPPVAAAPTAAPQPDKIDVQFAPDVTSNNNASQTDQFDKPLHDTSASPDDNNPPAQYAGEDLPKPKPATGDVGEADDMAID